MQVRAALCAAKTPLSHPLICAEGVMTVLQQCNGDDGARREMSLRAPPVVSRNTHAQRTRSFVSGHSGRCGTCARLATTLRESSGEVSGSLSIRTRDAYGFVNAAQGARGEDCTSHDLAPVT